MVWIPNSRFHHDFSFTRCICSGIFERRGKNIGIIENFFRIRRGIMIHKIINRIGLSGGRGIVGGVRRGMGRGKITRRG